MDKCNSKIPGNFNVGQSLIVASTLLKRKMDHEIYKMTGEDSITGANVQIIGFLASNIEREIYQKDIEKAFSLRPSTVSANLRLMEKKGFITRKYSTVDTRLKRVIPTDKALDLNQQACKKGFELEESFQQVLSKEEQDSMKHMLAKLIIALEKEES